MQFRAAIKCFLYGLPLTSQEPSGVPIEPLGVQKAEREREREMLHPQNVRLFEKQRVSCNLPRRKNRDEK